jgi:glyoxylase-like metal-dependent hydrolase (beta-lactamase superfamily II)
MHTDHSGGLGYFPKARIMMSDTEWRAARGAPGFVAGYPNNRWPSWLSPECLALPPAGDDLMASSIPITQDGTVRIVATPGHTKGHLSVSVESGGMLYLIAGDASYLLETMIEGVPDGHDPESARRLAERVVVKP